MRCIGRILCAALVCLALAHLAACAAEVRLIEFGRHQRFLRVGADIHRVKTVGAKALRISFSSAGSVRRFFGIEVDVKVANQRFESIVAVYRLTLTNGKPPRPCLVAFDAVGNSWFKSAQPISPTDEFAEARISLSGFHPTAFTRDVNAPFSIGSIRRLWVGFIAEGESSGVIELRKLSLSDEPYKPQPITVSLTGDWKLIKDPAVKGRLSLVQEGKPPKQCMKFEFTFPIGTHMYALPIIPIHDINLAEYSALQLTYRAELPEGISGLLICLWESDGSQYYAEPAPPPSSDWRTVTIPFSAFKLGGWSRDENGRLDLEQVDNIVIGVHGTAKGKDGAGFIIACDLKFVP